MTSSLHELLLVHPVFSQLSPTTRSRLEELAIPKLSHTGEILTHFGDVWPYLFMIGDGIVSVIKESSEGRGLAITELSAGELLWGPAFFLENEPNPATFKLKQESMLFLWSRERILPVLLENGNLTWELTKLMAIRMIKASEIIDGLAFRRVSGRLAQLLINYPDQNTSGHLMRSLTLDEMATRIGSTREMVCRFLQRFADQGLITITRTELEILDRDQLVKLAQEEKP
ncbi:MAG: Crp/Fnr family transcriptional regulator [Anaerolineaceae bacterium]|nr:Crp/Fnr family transcriptional regulator [Anaerolineaceae bacterium]